jgi:Kef-type K+ transport system membrane component KefB
VNWPTVSLLQAIILIGLPPCLWYYTPLKRCVPLVVVQIIIGILLGPSLLGRLYPELYAFLFPPESVNALNATSTLAIVFFSFTIGTHFDISTIRGRGRSFAMISLGSIVTPTLIGVGMGWWMTTVFPEAVGARSSVATFCLAIGVCIGVTALPVLAAILAEMRLLDHRIGQTALGLAVVNDAALWLLLAILLTSLVQHGNHGWSLWVLAIGGPVYILVIWFAVRPFLSYLAHSGRFVSHHGARHIVFASCIAFAFAAATDALGLHAVLGAFIAGTVLPTQWQRTMKERFEMVVITLLLPFFFMSTGLKVFVDPSAAAFSYILIVAILASILGKLIGTALPSRISGAPWSEALCLGSLMQTKGLMEVIVLTTLLDREVIAPTIFSVLVMAAVITTALSMPFARLALGRTNERDSRLSGVLLVPEAEG